MRRKSIHKYKFISCFFFLYGYPFCIFIFLNKSVNIIAKVSINSHFRYVLRDPKNTALKKCSIQLGIFYHNYLTKLCRTRTRRFMKNFCTLTVGEVKTINKMHGSG